MGKAPDKISWGDNVRTFFKDYKFIISTIIGLMGLIGLNDLLKYLNVGIQIIPWLIAFLNQYSGLLLLMLIVLSFYLAWKQLIIGKKLGMLNPQTLTFVSDQETVFIGSNTNRALPSNIKAVPIQPHPSWNRFAHPELNSAIWIADRPHISNEEAVNGGEYTFARDFDVPFDLSRMRSAELSLLVDDYCDVMVNQTRFPRVSGFQNIHKFDISKAVQKGQNHVQFFVENMNFRHKNDPNVDSTFYFSNEKFLMNPYGFRYSIEIEYFG